VVSAADPLSLMEKEKIQYMMVIELFIKCIFRNATQENFGSCTYLQLSAAPFLSMSTSVGWK
jgi:hypothetical protein